MRASQLLCLTFKVAHKSRSIKMTEKCIFCKICTKQEPTEFLYEDDKVVVFRDIKPAVQHHYLAVSIEHIQDISKLTAAHKPLLEKLISIGKQVLREKGCDMNDARFGFHCPPFNSINHLHLHVMAPVSEMSYFSGIVFKPDSWWFKTADGVLRRLENNPCK